MGTTGKNILDREHGNQTELRQHGPGQYSYGPFTIIQNMANQYVVEDRRHLNVIANTDSLEEALRSADANMVYQTSWNTYQQIRKRQDEAESRRQEERKQQEALRALIPKNINSQDRILMNSLSLKTDYELESILDQGTSGGTYTRRDLKFVNYELQSRKLSKSKTPKTSSGYDSWDKDVQDWFNAQMRAARSSGANKDTMVSIEASLIDQANRRQRNRRK